MTHPTQPYALLRAYLTDHGFTFTEATDDVGTTILEGTASDGALEFETIDVARGFAMAKVSCDTTKATPDDIQAATYLWVSVVKASMPFTTEIGEWMQATFYAVKLGGQRTKIVGQYGITIRCELPAGILRMSVEAVPETMNVRAR